MIDGFPRPDLTWDDVRHRFGNRTDTNERAPPKNLEFWMRKPKQE